MAQRKKNQKHQNSVRLLGRGDRLFKIWKTSPHLFASPHTLPKAGLILHIVLYKSIHPLEAPILPQQVPRPFKCVVLDIQAMGGMGSWRGCPILQLQCWHQGHCGSEVAPSSSLLVLTHPQESGALQFALVLSANKTSLTGNQQLLQNGAIFFTPTFHHCV